MPLVKDVIPEGYHDFNIVANVPELSRTRAEDPFANYWPVYEAINDGMILTGAVYDEKGAVFKNIYQTISNYADGNISLNLTLPVGRKFKVALFLNKGVTDYVFNAETKTIAYRENILNATNLTELWQSDDIIGDTEISDVFANSSAAGDAWLYYGDLDTDVSKTISVTLKRPFVQVIVLSNSYVGGGLIGGNASLSIKNSENDEDWSLLPVGYNFETKQALMGTNTYANNSFASNMTHFTGKQLVSYKGKTRGIVGNFYIFGSDKTLGGNSWDLVYMAKTENARCSKTIHTEEGLLAENTRIVIYTDSDAGLFDAKHTFNISVDSTFVE